MKSQLNTPRAALVLTAVSVGLLAMAGTTFAQEDEDEIPFAEAELFFELNNTDGDLGIHSSIDGEGWSRLRVEDPAGRRMLNIRLRGRLRRQGLTQLAFESTEPPFDELSPDVFFRRFPEGEYEITGLTLDGEEMESEALVTHVIPAAPTNILVNGALLPDGCDDGSSPSVSAGSDILIDWDPVVTTHSVVGSPLGSPDIDIVLYQIFIDQGNFGLAVDQDPSDTDLLIPAGLLRTGLVVIEILVREESGNQTASESCFVVE